MISRFSLCNFRSFYDEQYLDFAIPNRQHGIHGLTYILGENNAGKTSSLEAFRMRDMGPSSCHIRDNDLHNNKPVVFKTFDKNDVVIHELRQIRNNAASMHDVVEHPDNNDIIVIPARRYWTPKIQSGGDLLSLQSNDNFNSLLRQIPDTFTNSQVASMYCEIEHDDALYDKACKEIRKVFPDFHSFKTAFDDNVELFYLEKKRNRASC